MVTHDQVEAMTLADRIVVMNDRRIQQIGAPMEIYCRPANVFVAGFVGSPRITLASAIVIEHGSEGIRVKLGNGSEVATRVVEPKLTPGTAVQLGLRPEAVGVRAFGRGDVQAEAVLVERLGDRTLIYAKLADGQEITAEDKGGSPVRIGDKFGLALDGAAAHVFGPDGAGYHPAAAA